MAVNISKEGIDQVLKDLYNAGNYYGIPSPITRATTRGAELILKLSEAYDGIRAIRDRLEDELHIAKAAKPAAESKPQGRL
ncbi:hypothetical protein [Massilia sp. NP310]|uniref:hypothetical protein n=1 Tax=Massilia sp. NP310 TaxID=2861282 RepID=UPI001C635E79|nr:hypothetical protein [Massilia sp. NP310]QYG03984.1 hypothetical protein KY496_11700 [Massilia sp. NP310]